MLIRLREDCSSPLRYPGGDYRSSGSKVNLRPTKVKEFREAFGGGASMTFTMIRRGLADQFWLNDRDADLINFWTVVRDRSDELVKLLHDIRSKHGLGSEELFLQAEKMVGDNSPIYAAAGFWVRNRLSYAGTNGKSRYNPGYVQENRGLKASFIDNIVGFSELVQGVKITNLNYHEVLAEPGDGVFIYLDPPFDDVGNTMYPFGEENLEDLSKIVRQCPHNCLVKVNDSPANRDRFADMKPIVRSYHSNMGDHSDASEILAANYDAPLYEVYGRQIGMPLFKAEKAANDNPPELPVSTPVDNDKKRLFVNIEQGERCPEWYTPVSILKHLYAANAGEAFDVDPCTPTKGEDAPVWANIHFIESDNGLEQPWHGRVFMNPPYNKIAPWVQKAADSVWCKSMPNAPTAQSAYRETPDCETVIGLIPARTHTRWWQHFVSHHARVFFFHGKVKFRTGRIGQYKIAKSGFPEGVALVVWGNHAPFTDYLMSLSSSDLDIVDRSHPSIPDHPVAYWAKRDFRESVVSPVPRLIAKDESRRIAIRAGFENIALKEVA